MKLVVSAIWINYDSLFFYENNLIIFIHIWILLNCMIDFGFSIGIIFSTNKLIKERTPKKMYHFIILSIIWWIFTLVLTGYGCYIILYYNITTPKLLFLINLTIVWNIAQLVTVTMIVFISNILYEMGNN